MPNAAGNAEQCHRHEADELVGRKPASIEPCAENLLPTLLAKWKDVFLGTYRRINRDRILATAAGVVFYGLLAIFPAITAFVSSYGLFADTSTISKNLNSLAMLLPEGSFVIVQDEVGRVVEKQSSSLGLTFAFGLLLAIWSANSGTKAIIDALNVADEEEEERGFFRLNLVSLAFTVAGLIAVLFMVGAVVVVPLVLGYLGPDALVELLVQAGRWPVLALVLLVALMVLYRYGPSRRPPGWRRLSVGALVALVLWLIGSSLLSWYLSNFGSYTATYGSLGAAIGLMMWMWMSAIIILVGAELNSEIWRQAVVKDKAGSDQGSPAIAKPRVLRQMLRTDA